MENNLVDEFISRILILVLWKIASIKDFIGPFFAWAIILNKLKSIFLIVSYDHTMSWIIIAKVVFYKSIWLNVGDFSHISNLEGTLQSLNYWIKLIASKIAFYALNYCNLIFLIVISLYSWTYVFNHWIKVSQPMEIATFLTEILFFHISWVPFDQVCQILVLEYDWCLFWNRLSRLF